MKKKVRLSVCIICLLLFNACAALPGQENRTGDVSFKQDTLGLTPDFSYEVKEQKLDTLYDKLNIDITNIINMNIHKLDTIKIKVDLLNPNNILDKGYSIIYKNGKVVKDINSIKVNDEINIKVKDGNIDSVVKGVNK